MIQKVKKHWFAAFYLIVVLGVALYLESTEATNRRVLKQELTVTQIISCQRENVFRRSHNKFALPTREFMLEAAKAREQDREYKIANIYRQLAFSFYRVPVPDCTKVVPADFERGSGRIP